MGGERNSKEEISCTFESGDTPTSYRENVSKNRKNIFARD